MAEGAKDKPDSPPQPGSRAARVDLGPVEVLKGMRYSTYDGAFSSAWSALTSGAFLTGFALWLGAGSGELGLLSAVPVLAGLVQLFSSTAAGNSRRLFTARFAGAARGLWLLVPLLPLLLPTQAALAVFLILFAASNVMLNVPQPAWTSWMQDLVPPDSRGRYFGTRNMVAGLIGMCVSLPAAWLLDHASHSRAGPGSGFAALFILGAFAGLLSSYCLLQQPEPEQAPPPPAARSVPERLRFYAQPFQDRSFRRFMAFSGVFAIGQYFAAPFFNVYALEKLHLSYVWLQVFAAITSLSALGSMPLWGALSDKFGNKPLLALAVCGVFTLPVAWAVTSPAHPIASMLILLELNLTGGAFWAGVGLTQFNLLIGGCSTEKTPIYAATMAAVTGLAGGLAPMLGSAVLAAIGAGSLSVLGIHLSGFQTVFIASALIRLFSLPLLKNVTDEGALSPRVVLHHLGRTDPRDWLRIRQLQRPGDVEERLRATEGLRESRSLVAVDELSLALQDPSPDVREASAVTLGEIGDREALDALSAALSDPASGIGAAAAEALGKLGDAAAAGPLATVLNSYGRSPGDRAAAARALGHIGGEEAEDVLVAHLSDPDGEVLRSVIAALGDARARGAAQPLCALLDARSMDTGAFEAALGALAQIGDESAIPTLMRLLARCESGDSLLPALARALAWLGATEAVGPLVRLIPAVPSLVARAQTTHSVATLLDRGDCVYQLLSAHGLARTTAVARLVEELWPRRQRRKRAAPMLQAFGEARYRDFMLDAARLIESAQPKQAAAMALCAAMREGPAGSAELAVLAVCVAQKQ